MNLKELINILEKEDPNKIIKLGFHNPHSARAIYADLGVEPKENARVGDMLKCLRDALGQKYCGYKGGEFIMNEHVEIWLAEWGSSGELLGRRLIEYMLKDIKEEEQEK